jgi:hypothetical protein
MAVSSTHTGWRYDPANTRLDYYYRGTRAGDINATGQSVTGTLAVTGLVTASAALTVATGDNNITAGNVRLGTISTFGTTEPTAWIVFKSATQPAGAITTSGGLGANDTTVQKIIAAGTVNNVET